ncbi:potassium channel family protein [Clostridium novyi]|uniref:Membrane protein, putative n=2 Tax=Clostridium novyi TaxID=1542 RepID=A0Q0L0_CLONN|nr:potassium channel family protein [Clostridium novyi]ABK61079.1 membrane protein, putative [Clostridium novyi NT]KEH85413.1 Ion channel family protein [Clostridium novyi A str. NCTC 538]KEH85522.1 Ion channel family protein [Clostridium novyi A str. 4540]
MIVSIFIYALICIISILILHKQKNTFERFLMNCVLLMLGIISALYGLLTSITLYNGKPIYLKKPIIFSLLFISLLLVLMLYNMYFIWKDVNSYNKNKNSIKNYIYKNRFSFFLFVIIFSISLVIFSYGFIYYIINNLPPSIALDLKDNFMDNGERKSFAECVYFSAVTFFTVGFGDIVPRGIFFLGIILLEMTTSYLLTIISIPIFLSILIDGLRLEKKEKK